MVAPLIASMSTSCVKMLNIVWTPLRILSLNTERRSHRGENFVRRNKSLASSDELCYYY